MFGWGQKARWDPYVEPGSMELADFDWWAKLFQRGTGTVM